MSPAIIEAVRKFCESLGLGYAELVSAALAFYIWFLSRRYDSMVKDYKEDRVQLERMINAIEKCVEGIERLEQRMQTIELLLMGRK